MVKNIDGIKEKFRTLELLQKEVKAKWRKIRWWTLDEVAMALDKEKDKFENQLAETVEETKNLEVGDEVLDDSLLLEDEKMDEGDKCLRCDKTLEEHRGSQMDWL